MIDLHETKTLDNTQVRAKLSAPISTGNSDFKVADWEVVKVEDKEGHPMITSFHKLKRRQTTTE